MDRYKRHHVYSADPGMAASMVPHVDELNGPDRKGKGCLFYIRRVAEKGEDCPVVIRI